MMTIRSILRNMTGKILAIVFAAAVLVGCSKEDRPDPKPDFKAVTEGYFSTKVDVGYNESAGKYLATWVTGDLVWINGIKYAATAKDPATQADFTKAADETGATPEPTYKAFYPYGASVGVSGSNVTFTFPGEVKNSNSGVPFWPMYAESETNTLAFKNLCGLVQVKMLKLSTPNTVKSVQLSCTGHGLSGSATVSTAGEGVWQAVIASDQTKTIMASFDTAISVATWNCAYLPVPPGTYDDMSINITYGNGDSVTKALKTGRSIVVERSKVTAISFNMYSPEGSGTEDITAGNSYTEADFQ